MLKTPNIIYYVSWISCNNLIKILVHQALNTINCHTLIRRNLQIHALISYHLIACLHYEYLLKKTPEWIQIYLALTTQSSLETPMCVWCNQCITIVTTDSPSYPFTYLSTGSPLEITCTVVNCCIGQLINDLLFLN